MVRCLESTLSSPLSGLSETLESAGNVPCTQFVRRVMNQPSNKNILRQFFNEDELDDLRYS